MALSVRRTRACAPLALASSLALHAATVTAAPLAPLTTRPHGKVLGDGLHDGLDLSGLPSEPLAGQVCAAGDTLFGIDVSIFQGDIDWNAVASAGVAFAWIRASHGLGYEDPNLAANLAGARAAGVHAGVYQFFEPSEDPVAQAQLLLDMVGPLQPGDLPPMIDVESPDFVPPAAYADAVRAWIEHIEAATGVTPFIYTGYYYWNDHLATSEFAEYPLWIANYDPGCPLIPDAWATWTTHQYCDCGQLPGIDGDVDVNYFNGGMDELLGYAVSDAVCGDGKCSLGEDPYLNCPGDCPPCGVIGPQGGTIDDGNACLELLGDPQYWRHEPVGHGGALAWTYVTEYAESSNSAVWRMYFAEAGTYTLEVWIEQPFGDTRQSVYRVQHAGGETLVPIDQSLTSGWVSLGEFPFDAATDHFVRLDDNTGELLALELQVTADALQISRVNEDVTTGATSPGTSSGGGTGGATSSPTEPVDAGSSSSSSSSSGTGGAGGPGLPEGDGADDGGCGCRGAPQPAGGSLLALAALLGLRRRRS